MPTTFPAAQLPDESELKSRFSLLLQSFLFAVLNLNIITIFNK